MTKSKIHAVADSVIMVAILMLPILLVCLSAFRLGTFGDALEYWDGRMDGTPFYEMIDEVIGPAGEVPIIPSTATWMIDYLAWFGTFYVLRLFAEVLTFVPKLIKSLIDRVGGDSDDR